MPSSTSNFDFARPVPQVPWRGVLLAVALLSTAAIVGWEIHARRSGYGPTLNDTSDLWAETRGSVQPDSVVLLGTSRMLFDMDLDELERGLGRRPKQLALVGSSPFPVLADLAQDESFHGTVLLDVVPAMYFAPPGSPPYAASEKALKHYRSWNYAQKWSHALALPLERQLAFTRQEDLTLAQLLERVEVPNRPGALVGPKFPPYFYSLERDRRARMVPEAAIVDGRLNREITGSWRQLFVLPPPPTFVPLEVFGKMMHDGMEARFAETTKLIARLQARGGRVIFLRLPVTGPLVEMEEKMAPRVATWDRLLRENPVPAIHFAEHADLSAFTCPEWSHLSAADSVEFTRRLVPHLQAALKAPPAAGKITRRDAPADAVAQAASR